MRFFVEKNIIYSLNKHDDHQSIYMGYDKESNTFKYIYHKDTLNSCEASPDEVTLYLNSVNKFLSEFVGEVITCIHVDQAGGIEYYRIQNNNGILIEVECTKDKFNFIDKTSQETLFSLSGKYIRDNNIFSLIDNSNLSFKTGVASIREIYTNNPQIHDYAFTYLKDKSGNIFHIRTKDCIENNIYTVEKVYYSADGEILRYEEILPHNSDYTLCTDDEINLYDSVLQKWIDFINSIKICEHFITLNGETDEDYIKMFLTSNYDYIMTRDSYGNNKHMVNISNGINNIDTLVVGERMFELTHLYKTKIEPLSVSGYKAIINRKSIFTKEDIDKIVEAYNSVIRNRNLKKIIKM